jgi:hypothetical protein
MDHELPPELAPRRDELLARVTRRGRALRARRLGVLATILVVVIGIPIAAFAVVSDGGDHQKVAAVAPTTNVSAETSTTAAPSSKAVIEVLSVTPAGPSVGEPVTFTVRTDANCDVNTDFGDERAVTSSSCTLVCASGPPSTPTTKPNDAGLSKSYTHVYSVPGDYTATFIAHSGTCEGGSSTVSASVSVHVVDQHVLTTIPGSAGPPDTTVPNATVPQTTVP